MAIKTTGDKRSQASAKAEDQTPDKHPAGLYLGVCIDVIDRGIKETQYGPKERFQVLFQTSVDHPTFDGHFRLGKYYNYSNSDRSTFVKDVLSWTGQNLAGEVFTIDDIAEGLIGKSAMLNIVHNGRWANIDSILPLPKGQEPLVPDGSYTRVIPESKKVPVEMPDITAVYGDVDPDDELPF